MATAIVEQNRRLGPRPRPFVAQGTAGFRVLAEHAGKLAFPRPAKCYRARGVSADMVKRLRNGGDYLAPVLALIDAADIGSAIEAALLAAIRSRAEDVAGTLDELRATDDADAEVEGRHRLAVRRAIEALLSGERDDAALHAAMDVTLEEAAVAVDQLAKIVVLHNALHARKGGVA